MMRNKSNCFEILRVYSQRDGITNFFPPFLGPEHKKKVFFACANSRY